MNGEDLISFINSHEWLKFLPIDYTILELLKKEIIKPSTIIDAYSKMMNEKCHRYRSHFEDSCVSALQLFNGHFKGENYEEAKKRFLYNTSFSECFPGLIGTELTEEDRKKCKKFFEVTYGFDPENL